MNKKATHINVSVVLPCYNGEDFLRAAVESYLVQVIDSELIIVNDGSPDRCGAIADELAAQDSRIRVLHHTENIGVAEAFNTGFNAAEGKYLMRLAQDDLLKPAALEELALFLDQHSEIAMVYADMEVIDSDGKVNGFFRTGDPTDVLKKSARIGLCWMFRREVWDAGYRFDPKYDQVEDFEFWMRVAREFTVYRYEGVPLLQFRQHDAMGTKAHAAKMEVLTAKLLAQHPYNSGQSKQILAEGYLNASWAYRENGCRGKAVLRAIQAWTYTPFSGKCLKNILGACLR